METTHIIRYDSAAKLDGIDDDSVDLVVTSPPYPMVEMWDETFTRQNTAIGDALESLDGPRSFSLMHAELDAVWREVFRVLKPGGMACINIGDAVRSIGNDFRIYNSHSRVAEYCISLGFRQMPSIIWRKQTNAPNKFMGSGMLPPGAYVTLEHEHILIFRKGERREFKEKCEKDLRRESAYFWEERNQWFSDVWYDLKGIRQALGTTHARERSGAFPFELPFRLISMFSLTGDIVLDPFAGTATTSLSSIATGRNSIAYEVDGGLRNLIEDRILSSVENLNSYIERRLQKHRSFIQHRLSQGLETEYFNRVHDTPVVTGQETFLHLRKISRIMKSSGKYTVEYSEF